MRAPADHRGDGSGRKAELSISAQFLGTDNPRHKRVIMALITRAMRREDVDRAAGCSNGPDLIAQLRRLGLEIPCTRIPAFDRDGRPCQPGAYHLTAADRRKLYRWFRQMRCANG